MRLLSGLAVLIALLDALAFRSFTGIAAPRQAPSALVIDGVSVVDVIRGEIRAPMRVLIRNNRIVSVERAPRSALTGSFRSIPARTSRSRYA